VIKKIVLMLLLMGYVHAESLPLEGRKFGVEFNIPRLLTYSDSWQSASGTFSYFDHEDSVEVAFPWLVSNQKSSGYYGSDRHFDVINMDIHYRKFLGDKMDGFYLSGFGRVSHLNGLLDDEDRYKKTVKFGLGVGLGYRLFPISQRYYWGIGLIVGRYVSGENEIYQDVDFSLEDSPIIVDIEFLKFGYAF